MAKTEKVTDMIREGAAAWAVAEGEGDAMAEVSAGDVVVEADDDDEIFLDDDDEVFLEDDDDFLEDDDDFLEDDDDDDDFIDLTEDDGSGWLPDPEVRGQERFWDGTEWTDEVRPADEPVEDTEEETDQVRPVWEPVEEIDEVRPLAERVEEEEDEDEEVFESDDEALDAVMEDDGSGWMNDPKVAGQERFWDGTEWTDQVRPVEEEVEVEVRRGRHALPDHVPELQRAMAAATDDIDDVEDRLSSLFERIDERGRKKRGAEAGAAARPGPVPVSRASGESRLHEQFEAISSEGADDPMYMRREEAGPAFRAGDDDEATFADLDAALAEEAPDKPSRRRFFKRRS